MKWGTPQTAEELAAQPQRPPYYDLLVEHAERTGQPVALVSYVTPSGLNRNVLDAPTRRWVHDQWKAGWPVEGIWRELHDDGLEVSISTLYRMIQRANRRQPKASNRWD